MNERVAILTTFQEFNPYYSLTGIVKDQVAMLLKYGHHVNLYVAENFSGGASLPSEWQSNPLFALKPEIPHYHLTDYFSIKDIPEYLPTLAIEWADRLRPSIEESDIVLTHDFIFTGWFLPYAMMVRELSKPDHMKRVKWLHWIHSVPSGRRDWWSIREYGGTHKIAYPNASDALLVAEQFRGILQDVRVIPHIKDMRTWFDFDPETCSFIEQYPAVMQSSFVQILPASADRMSAKRVDDVIRIFGNLKSAGFSVCLVIANQWATTVRWKEDIAEYRHVANLCNLTPDEVIFTSEYKAPTFETGLPKRMLRELFQLSNLFIFPTREESFGLVVPEAALSGGVLLVLNRSLQQQIEISGMTGLYFNFGSFHQEVHIPNIDQYLSDIAKIIVGRFRENESILAKTFMRQHYNMDRLYNRVYAPIFGESALWE